MEQLPRFDRDKKSLSKSNSRRFGQGRIVVAHEKFEANPWLTVSDLAVAGRPVQQNESEQGAPTVKLPRGQEFLLPECGSPAELDRIHRGICDSSHLAEILILKDVPSSKFSMLDFVVKTENSSVPPIHFCE